MAFMAASYCGRYVQIRVMAPRREGHSKKQRQRGEKRMYRRFANKTAIREIRGVSVFVLFFVGYLFRFICPAVTN